MTEIDITVILHKESSVAVTCLDFLCNRVC